LGAGTDDGPAPVDFDALHAALGDPFEFDELPAASSELTGASDDFLDGLARECVGESDGQSSAAYASARPHTIPPSYAPTEDLNAPPVIVASDDDAVPSAPPHMTVPIVHVRQPIGDTPQSGVPFLLGRAASGVPYGPSGPHPLGPPRSAPHVSAPSRPSYPQMSPAVGQRGAVGQMTMPGPDHPLNLPSAKTRTLVVRLRGPSAMQKLIAFMAMLLLVTACGIAVIIWKKPVWLRLDPAATLVPTTAAPVSLALPADTSTGMSPVATAPSITVAAAAVASATPAAPAASPASPVSLSASAAAPVKVVRPRPPPAPPPTQR
jgi:hypothetical protein